MYGDFQRDNLAEQICLSIFTWEILLSDLFFNRLFVNSFLDLIFTIILPLYIGFVSITVKLCYCKTFLIACEFVWYMYRSRYE